MTGDSCQPEVVRWSFSLQDPRVDVTVGGAPTEETRTAYWEQAIPQFVGAGVAKVATPVVVLAQVTAPAKGGQDVPSRAT